MKRKQISIGKERPAQPLFALVLAVLVVAAIASLFHGRSALRSPELGFSDPSKDSGLQIVPASCASGVNAPTSPDGNGYIIYSGASDQWVYKNGYDYCVTNSSGNTYFLPALTASEMSYFFTYLPPGVSYTPYYIYYYP
jgi:hypothetical protein